MYNTIIIGGGVAGMQCALVLGSAKVKPYAKGKKVGIVLHQKSSQLQTALFNNVLGVPKGKLGSDILKEGKEQLQNLYPEVDIIEKEKVIAVLDDEKGYKIVTNKKEYFSANVVIALNYAKPFEIEGLQQYVERHCSANPMKDRIQLRNFNHLIKKGLYACGTIAGWRSQFAIAAGSGASVATDILTVWNNHTATKVHDKTI